MPAIKYLCVDDQPGSGIEDLLRGLAEDGVVVFQRITPSEIGGQVDAIVGHAQAARADGFGLLLDLRLDEELDAQGNKVSYRGPTLAQELRTRMYEGAIFSFPIALWSINAKFITSFYGDDTSHDLFDGVYGKDEEINSVPARVAKELSDLVMGYREIDQRREKRSGPQELIGLSPGDNLALYGDFIDELKVALDSSTHQVAQLLRKELVLASGLLVDDGLLAARLGVDRCLSVEPWERLKAIIEFSKYSGPFSDAWPRWWWFRVDSWWLEIFGGKSSLRRLTADQRVDLLNKKFDLELCVAAPMADGCSSKFFSLCVATGAPIDPADGLRVVSSNRKSWQDVGYVSIGAALERQSKTKANWRIDPLDRSRFDAIKQGL
ncbi:MAG: hypothetical protein Q7T32_12650 [Moraxellaceae bacterium]|nr:hypothetical protein [Moraxellaceae bacterium]